MTLEKILEHPLLNTVILENSIKNYILSLIFFIVLFYIIKFIKNNVIKKIEKIFKQTTNTYDDLFINILNGISNYFLWFISFYASIHFLKLSENTNYIIQSIAIIFITYEMISAAKKVINFFVKKISHNKDLSTKTAYKAIEKFANIGVLIFALLFILSNLGVNITALATGLGIGGLAIAFAFQEILKDLFSYFTILLDKPIKEGDFIYIGEQKGTVQSIGIKTTRLKAIDGDEIVVSNNTITDEKLKNFGKTKHRRIKFEIGVAYDTPIEKLKNIKTKITEIIRSFKDTEFHRCHLRTLGDSSINFEIVYEILIRDYTLYMDINEEINFAILEYFEKENIEIPFPTRTIYNK